MKTIAEWAGIEEIHHTNTSFSIKLRKNAALTTLDILAAIVKLAAERAQEVANAELRSDL